MKEGITYTQKIDEKTGEIKYVPNQPPKSDGDGDGDGEGNGKAGKSKAGAKDGEGKDGSSVHRPSGKHGSADPDYYYESSANDWFLDMVDNVNFGPDPKMTELLKRLDDNNKRLRYDTRIETGKLDTRRLTAYKTSTRLFKRKAIKHKDYQFTIMLDTSGSMFGDEHNSTSEHDHHIYSKIHIGLESIAKVVKSLEELNIPVAVIAMNFKTNLLKSYDASWDEESFVNRLQHNMVGKTNALRDPMGGTEESVAYGETLKYIASHTKPKTHNVVILLSDGEPGSGGDDVDVTFEGETYQLDSKSSDTDSLRNYWERQSLVTPYGIGLLSDAKQMPRSQRLNHIDKLPELMSNLIQEILL